MKFFVSLSFVALFRFITSITPNGFLYFTSLDDLSNNYDRKIKAENWSANQLVNFQWDSSRPKTLVCHDFVGGYLDYERYVSCMSKWMIF